MNSVQRRAMLALLATAALAASGCGSPPAPGDAGRDATNGQDAPRPDAGLDTGPRLDSGTDTSAPPDAGADATLDTRADAAPDATGADAGPDASTDTGPSTDGAPPSCLNNTDCGRREYCAAATCGGRGTCAAQPLTCPTTFDPVCGCDGITYANACGAAAAGARVASTGACGGGDAGPSACTSNATCGATEFCAAATCVGAGTCTPRPRACPDVVDPVCGCDGMEYGNACEAAAAGVRVSSRGRCSEPPPGDGGLGYCAMVRCGAGTMCCESLRMCVAIGGRCPCAAPCGAGTVCCEMVSVRGAGTCYDPRCLACCM